MYSLYRAWFGDSVIGDSYSRLQETLSPPDTVVRVGNEGEHQFVAHKGVLAAHSGYLKALLTSAATTPNSVNANVGSCGNLPATAIAVTTANLSGQSPPRQPVTSVSVSSIGGEAFAPLLNYMYTGRLEVTLDNVYSVLLATHLLHMPGALEQCRAALLRLRAPPPLPTPIPVGPTSTLTSTPGSTNILRPIPNRLMIDPSMCWPPTAPLYPPTAPSSATIGIPHLPQLQPSVLMQSSVPLGVPVTPPSTVQETQTSARYSKVPSPKPALYQIERNRGQRETRQKSPEHVRSSSLPFVAAAAAAFTAFATARASSPTHSVSPAPSTGSQSSLPSSRSKKSTTTEQRRYKEDRDRDYEQGNPNGTGESQARASPLTTTNETTTVNRNRDRNLEGPSIPDNDRPRSSKRRGRGSNGNESSSSGVLSVVYDVACCDGPVKFHRVLNENYSSSAASCPNPSSQTRLQRSCFETENAFTENDENGGPPTTGTTRDPTDSTIDPNTTNESYSCGYCRHTFKSQYCYRKHTKRHLLPTRANDSIGNRQRQDLPRSRREVRLLDLNVQYYPCKICGCKFPSYYFVHKHRKLCHANIEERQQSEETSAATTEDRKSTASTTNENQ
ncbi:uncharacterized protein LOC143154022 [Ptiloglossa arizonensis]|uniref:uncharacterized protein LOC143154022 n=1 Tax=Ptiloglossa arizonensis TaxID=3350558 RepID=UPI003F9FA0AC